MELAYCQRVGPLTVVLQWFLNKQYNKKNPRKEDDNTVGTLNMYWDELVQNIHFCSWKGCWLLKINFPYFFLQWNNTPPPFFSIMYLKKKGKVIVSLPETICYERLFTSVSKVHWICCFYSTVVKCENFHFHLSFFRTFDQTKRNGLFLFIKQRSWRW